MTKIDQSSPKFILLGKDVKKNECHLKHVWLKVVISRFQKGAMGKAMKSKPLQKGPKAKAKAKAKSSCKKNKTGGKKAMKTLTSANLRRLEKSQGQMSLQDKLKKAGEEDTVEGAKALLQKALLQKLMTKDEKTKLWSKHQTYLRGQPR